MLRRRPLRPACSCVRRMTHRSKALFDQRQNRDSVLIVSVCGCRSGVLAFCLRLASPATSHMTQTATASCTKSHDATRTSPAMYRRRKEKDMRIRVIGLHDHDEVDCSELGTGGVPRGSVIELSLEDLLSSAYDEEYADEAQPLWIQVEHATPDDVQRIGEHFGLHPLTIEGVQTRHTREKLEIFQGYLFLVFHALHGGATQASGAFGHLHPPRSTKHAAGTFAANKLVDPSDMTRAQAARLGGRASVDDETVGKPPTNEGSRLLPAQTTAKYYGADAGAHMHRGSSAAMPAQSPLPPRRHKSQLSLSVSSSSLNSLSTPATLAPRRTPSPQPQPTPIPTPPRSRNDRSSGVTPPDRFQLPYPLGMGPDEVSPPGDNSSDSSTSGASDTSMSEFEDQDWGSPSPALMTPHEGSVPPTPHLGGSSNAISAQVAALARDTDPLRTSPIKLVVFPHLVLSFHSSGLDTVNSVRHRLSRVYSDSVESTAWIIHALLDSITDSLLPVVNATAMEVDALEELIYVLSGSEHRDLLKRMGMTRRRLGFLRQRLWSKRDILMSLIGKEWQTFLGGVQIPYLRDVYDHIVTMLHKIEAASDLLVALQNTYLANVQIDVAEASNDANVVMKQMTAVGAIILPMQLVSGLWGMNCPVPWQKELRHPFDGVYPFLTIVLGMVFVTAVMMGLFRRTNLL